MFKVILDENLMLHVSPMTHNDRVENEDETIVCVAILLDSQTADRDRYTGELNGNDPIHLLEFIPLAMKVLEPMDIGTLLSSLGYLITNDTAEGPLDDETSPIE